MTSKQGMAAKHALFAPNAKEASRNSRIAIILLSLALLSCLAYASEFDEFKASYNEAFENKLTGGWWGMAIAAVLACISLNILVYMAGYAFNSEHLKRYAKSEFLQVSASSVLIFFIVALLFTVTSGAGLKVSAFDFMGDLLGKGSYVSCAAGTDGRFLIFGGQEPFGAGPIGAFKCKVQEKITALDNAFERTYNDNDPTEKLTSSCLSLFGAPVWCWDWDMRLHKEVEMNHLVETKIVGLLMPLHAQYSLAEYLQKNMLSVFLPFGLLLRIFPITRGIGGLFIAMAIGFFFIWPAFVILTDPTFVKVDEPEESRISGMCFTGFSGTAVLLQVTDFGGGGTQDPLATSEGSALVYEITVAALFSPFISLVLTLIFIRAATPLLGGDTGELMRMVARLG